jgi:hypothetical protein
MTSLFGNQKANIKLKLKALPVFNKEKGAIFLQEMEVVDAWFSGQDETGSANPDALSEPVAAQLFNQQPAYVLSEDKSKGEALAKKYAKGIEVKPGEIIIPFTD